MVYIHDIHGIKISHPRNKLKISVIFLKISMVFVRISMVFVEISMIFWLCSAQQPSRRRGVAEFGGHSDKVGREQRPCLGRTLATQQAPMGIGCATFYHVRNLDDSSFNFNFQSRHLRQIFKKKNIFLPNYLLLQWFSVYLHVTSFNFRTCTVQLSH